MKVAYGRRMDLMEEVRKIEERDPLHLGDEVDVIEAYNKHQQYEKRKSTITSEINGTCEKLRAHAREIRAKYEHERSMR